MTDPSLVDQMTRLKLRLLEKKLENERENMEDRTETAMSARSYDGHEDTLQSALRKRKDLLQRLREERLLDEIARPHTWGGTRRKYVEPVHQVDPMHIYHVPPPAPPPPPPLPPPPEPLRIIQHTMPQQPATIIQQLPQQQPLITQIPPPQPLQPIRSGSIKEDMVELMLMQNAQMHQIIMHNMMLKALPPMAFSAAKTQNPQQDLQTASPILVKAEKPRPSSVHHHHHYAPPGIQSNGPPIPPVGYPMWASTMPSNLTGQLNGFPPAIHHMTNLPPMNTTTK
ncbi:uncharacterized protein C21orf58 homolog isoform X2 [Protopterus annectens]|uniref:uncharacterized protein C21orf58 homolog isoform X2 n=1 Tax=Protopterus annectens TaxID=7888 RepID=UPI001CF9CC54|nr:uncharacterized protein C21orf58 homolog isoform X2 [Protopterus annectens]